MMLAKSFFNRLFLIFSALLIAINTKLSVRWPQDLSQRFDQVNGIAYYVINPESSTEKKSFIGNLVLAEPENGCQRMRPVFGEEISNPIAVITAGECSFAQKAKNAELAGAKLALILSDNANLTSYHQKNQQQSKDFPVHIETLIVEKTHGDILKTYLKDHKTSFMLPELSYTLDIDKYIHAQQRSNPVRIDYWYAASNLDGSSQSTLFDLQTLIFKLLPTDRIVFSPHYVLWRDDTSSLIGDYNERCLSGSRYCDPEPGDLNLGGGESVLEDLRQLCLFQVSDNIDKSEYWWNYVIKFSQNCMSKKEADLVSCRTFAYELAGVPSDIVFQADRCMRDSFIGGVRGGANTNLRKIRVDNSLLKKEYEEQQGFDLITYPSIYVNDARYDGSLRDFEGIRDFICDHFPIENDPPNGCSRRNLETVPNGQAASGFFIYLAMGLFSVLFMVSLIYCVRRNIRREIMGKMNEEIATVVNQYTQIKN